jgi:hypothetical protein
MPSMRRHPGTRDGEGVGHRRPARVGGPPGPQPLDDPGGDVDERRVEGAGDRGDHLARWLLDAALDLGEVLRGQPGSTGGLGEGLTAIVT